MARLERRIGPVRAGAIGVSAMLGAGVFAVWRPAALAAGEWLLLALVIAALVAVLNALSVAQLAVSHPTSGGVYAFGRALLSPFVGTLAGWFFLIGKLCSAATMSLVIAAYVWPAASPWFAAVVIAVLVALDVFGIRSTAAIAFAVAAIVLVGLGVVLLLRWAQPQEVIVVQIGIGDDVGPEPPPRWYGIAQGAALLFFAFAGYARMATLGEEVRDPRRNLPRAILGALAIVLVVYAAVGATLLGTLGVHRMQHNPAPLASGLGPDVGQALAVLAALGAGGALLGLIAGLGRTSFAMARDGALPHALARIARSGVPAVAEVSLGVVAIVAALALPMEFLLASSSCCVLLYYAIGHVAALAQPRAERWLPRAVPVLGLLGCAVLAIALPLPSILVAVATAILATVAQLFCAGTRSSGTPGNQPSDPR